MKATVYGAQLILLIFSAIPISAEVKLPSEFKTVTPSKEQTTRQRAEAELRFPRAAEPMADSRKAASSGPQPIK